MTGMTGSLSTIIVQQFHFSVIGGEIYCRRWTVARREDSARQRGGRPDCCESLRHQHQFNINIRRGSHMAISDGDQD